MPKKTVRQIKVEKMNSQNVKKNLFFSTYYHFNYEEPIMNIKSKLVPGYRD